MNIEEIRNAVIGNDAGKLKELIQQNLEQGMDPETLLNQGLIGAMDIVGEKFSAGELYVPEMLQSAMAMKEGLKLLKPLLVDSAATRKGTIVVGTVKGDLHDIGKNLVAMMLEGAGFQVIDLGVDVDPESFLKGVRENQAQVYAMSALLTTTMPSMKETIELVKREISDRQVKTIIGGAPLSQKYADDIGADGFAPDAGAAVEKIKMLIGRVSL